MRSKPTIPKRLAMGVFQHSQQAEGDTQLLGFSDAKQNIHAQPSFLVYSAHGENKVNYITLCFFFFLRWLIIY